MDKFGTFYVASELNVRGKAINVIVVDVMHTPLRPRKEAFVKLGRLVDKYGDKPLVIMGDFNTPMNSVYMKYLNERQMKESFDSVGQGWHLTWPTHRPFLDIDQFWANPKITLKTADLEHSWLSDHFALTVTFDPK